MYRIGAAPHWLWDSAMYFLMFLLIFLLAAIFGDSLFASMAGKEGLDRLSGAWNAALGLVLIIATIHALAMSLIPRVTRALGVSFGQESLLDNLLVDIRSAVTPPNAERYTWTKYRTAEGGWLRHSRLYQNPESVEEVARFISASPAGRTTQ
jgi:hypothetical protein